MLLLGKSTCAGWALVLGLLSQAAQAKWALTLRPADERARACQEQVSFCYNTCGSVARTAQNFCNIRTMGWNCACADQAAERKIRRFEWPIASAECRAALAMCNDGCAARDNGSGRSACYASCTTDYPCNTAAAPASGLRVQSANDLPAGYIPPADDRDMELPIGMKLGVDAQGQGASDPGVLPKVVPRRDDAPGAAPVAGRTPRNGLPAAGRHAGAGGRADASSAPQQHEQRLLLAAAAAALLLVGATLG
ncbi:hypothetical protein LPJ61_003752 [Coemansia biformis]|uniref:DUF7707 domain-containing protein n=1 Tax=Coemansia biformis TaxID=1286918 RepID=A0A9W7YD91_9FUNG|nr:hypothetical protein LPJ61_003752 [Coemansia biformis]